MKFLQELLNHYVGQDLSGVTFVRDYLQLQFNPPLGINVYSICTVRTSDHQASFGAETFANLLLSLIGSYVVDAKINEKDKIVVLIFEGDAVILLPYSDGSFVGPEALEIWGSNNEWMILR